jgi:hypothetical protein
MPDLGFDVQAFWSHVGLVASIVVVLAIVLVTSFYHDEDDPIDP